MASEGDGVRPDTEEEEDGGGPVKTFLEHLEDLRWTLVKCFVSLALAMVVCLVAGKYLVAFMTWPLKHAYVFAPKRNTVPVMFGTNVIARLGQAEVESLGLGTNFSGVLRFVTTGTNRVVTLQPDSKPADENPTNLVLLKNYSPLSSVVIAMKLAFYGGLIIAAPLLIYFIGQFVLPALKVKEKRILYRVAGFGSVLFFLGVAFCYFVIMAVALGATVQFSEWMGFAADEWRAEDYISFTTKFMLGLGLSFELPVIILTLVKIGLLDYQKLNGFRSYAVVGNLVLAAFVTPSGDPVTMVLLALPLQVLYELSVVIAWYWHREDRKRAAEASLAASGSKEVG